MEPLDLVADELLDGRNDLSKRVAVIGIARQRLCMDGELAALAALERGGDAHLDAELVRFVRLTFAYAFDLGRVQAVDLGAALAALLLADSPGAVEECFMSMIWSSRERNRSHSPVLPPLPWSHRTPPSR